MNSVGQVAGHIMGHGGGPTGEVFVLAHGAVFDPGAMDCEARVAVGSPVPDGPEVKGRDVPGGLHARAVRKGPCTGMPPVCEALWGFVRAEGLEAFLPFREICLNGPADTPPDWLLTEVLFPVRHPGE